VTDNFAGLTESERRHALSKILLHRIGGANRPHPLSYGQEARWSLVCSSPESGVENHSFAWRIGAAFDLEAFRLAVHALLKSYACLRSVFGTYESHIVRYVQQEFVVPFAEYDLGNDADLEINVAIAREASKPFDLRSGPLIRVGLFRRPKGEHSLLVTAHHIVVDFWSLGIALRKLGEAYLTTVGGLPVEPQSDEADYDEFVLWEALRVLGPEGEAALHYWGRQFADGLDFVKLPTDRDWPAQRGFRDAEYRFTLGDRSVDKLRAVGRKQDCTLFAVMLALFNILIYSYTGQQSIGVISPVSARSQLGFENQVGDLSNFLLLRARLDERQDFAAFLRQVRQTVIDAMEHRDFPISLVTKRLQVRGLPEGAVPFPLRFNMPRAHLMKGEMAEPLDGEPRLTVALDAFHAELEFVDRRVTGSSELNLGFFKSQRGLLGSLQYNVELFDEATISQMVARLSHLATIVGERADISIRDLAASCEHATAL
jgi:hypothetical protein